MRVLLIVPAYNEEKNILAVVNRIREYRKKCDFVLDYVVINDCSTDSTKIICDENGIHSISLVKNLGIGGAVQTGYIYARMNDYDIAVQFDGDGQHDIESLKDLIEPVACGEADFAVGSRFADEKSSSFKSTAVRRIGIKYFSRLIQLLVGENVTDPTSGYRAANRTVISIFASDYPYDYPEPESLVWLSKSKQRITEVPVNMFERQGGVSSINSWKSVYYIIKVSAAIIFAGFQRKK